MSRIGKKDTEKAGSRWLFSDFWFKRENGVGEGENKHKGNPGVQKVQVFTFKSKAAKTEYLISSSIVLGVLFNDRAQLRELVQHKNLRYISSSPPSWLMLRMMYY